MGDLLRTEEVTAVAIPQGFGSEGRDAFRKALELADVARAVLVDEAVAAAIAYEFDVPDEGTKAEEGEIILVYDLGAYGASATLVHRDTSTGILSLLFVDKDSDTPLYERTSESSGTRF